MNGIESHQIREDFVLILIDNTFFFAHIDHRQHFLTADGRLVFVVRESTGNQFHQQHKRIKNIYQRPNRTRRETHQIAPIGRSDDLGNNLSENKNENGHASRYEAEPLAAEHLCCLHTDTSGSYCVGDRIKRQNSG